MNRRIYNIKILLLLSVLFSCFSSRDYLKLNTKVNKNEANKYEKIMIPSGAFVDSFQFIKNGVVYNLGISSNNKIVFISTADKNFFIGNLKIEDTLSEENLKNGFKYVFGWGYYLQIDNEWYVGFDYATMPNEKSKIKWFFKYDF